MIGYFAKGEPHPRTILNAYQQKLSQRRDKQGKNKVRIITPII